MRSVLAMAMSWWVLQLGAANCARGNPEIPGARQSQPIALVGGTLHPVSGPAIENGTLLLVDGKIAALGTDVTLPENALTVDCTGRHIYPALFDAHTILGLTEIESVRATRDSSETGLINPNVRSQVAVNPDSELIPVTRSNGVLLALTAPAGGLISGQSAILQLDGWTYEDLTLKAAVGMHVQWPRVDTVLGEASTSRSSRSLDALRAALDQARAYRQAKEAGRSEIDVRWEALLPVLDGSMPLIVTADEIQQIQSAVAFAEREQLRIILHGGYDAPHCAELLRRHDVPVIVAGVYRLPMRRADAYDAAYTLPERLRQSGIRYCISGAERTANTRNLPYHAATAAAYGLPRDEALKSVTLYPAQILGVADRVGSLEVGKDATLIVTTGDPLETATQVRAAYVQGRNVSLDDRHKRLYRKYREKYRRQQASDQPTTNSQPPE
jgi:imidazolonepropionase-like amidohydrolase